MMNRIVIMCCLVTIFGCGFDVTQQDAMATIALKIWFGHRTVEIRNTEMDHEFRL